MRALWSDRENSSHNASQKFKRIRRVSDSFLVSPYGDMRILGLKAPFSRVGFRPQPCPSFPSPIFQSLFFGDFLAFFICKEFLAFLSVFLFFPRNFRGSEERKILAFWWFSLLFAEKARKGRSGLFVWISLFFLLARNSLVF